MNQLRHKTTYVQSIPIVALTGEIDMMSSAPVTSRLAELLDRKPPALVVDLREVRFFGSEGIRALVETQVQADELGIKLESVNYTQGEYDFVDVVEAPSPEAMLHFSVWYVRQGFGRIQSLPAFDDVAMAAAVQKLAAKRNPL